MSKYRWLWPVLGGVVLLGLLSRRSSDPFWLGRYSHTLLFFLLAWAWLAVVLIRNSLNPARWERVRGRFGSNRTWGIVLAIVAAWAATGFALRMNRLTPWLAAAMAVMLTAAGEENARGHFRRVASGLLASVVSLLLALLAAEFALAIWRPVPAAVESLMYYEPDPHTGYRQRPNSVGEYQLGIPARANRYGHRDDEVAIPKPAGVYRILVLGDSYTMGYNVREEEAFPQILKRVLRERMGDSIEVVNAGVSGWQPFQYAQYFLHEGRRFEPDMVLVGFFIGNDAFNQDTSVEDTPTAIRGVRVSREAAKARTASFRIWLYERSNLARLWMNRGVLTGVGNRLDFTRRECGDFTDHHVEIARAWLENHLPDSPAQRQLAANGVRQMKRILDVCGPKGIPVVVFLIPFETQTNPELRSRLLNTEQESEYDWSMPQSMLREMMEKGGLIVIDPLADFQSSSDCLYNNDAHWNVAGHALGAEVLIRAIEPMIRPSQEVK